MTPKCSSWLIYDLIAAVPCTVAVVLAFQGIGSHSVFVGMAAAFPAACCAFSHDYRRRIVLLYRQNFETLHAFRFSPRTNGLPWRSAFLWVGLPAMILSLLNGANVSSMDNYPTSLMASTIVQKGTTELSDYLRSTGPNPQEVCEGKAGHLPYFLRCTRRGIYSAYPPGMLLFSLPFTLVSRTVGGDIGSGKAQWRLAKWTSACVAGLSMVIFLLLSCYLVPASDAIRMSLALFTGSTMLGIVGQGLWTQSGVMLGFLILIFVEVRRPVRGSIPLQAMAIALMLACRLTACALVLPFGLWFLSRDPKRTLKLALLSVLLLSPLVIYNLRIYDFWLGPQMLMASGKRLYPHLEGLIGILFSPACGLFVYQPWLLLGVACLFPSFRDEVRKRFGHSSFPLPYRVVWSAILLHLLVFCSWPEWWSGVYGTRYLTEVIPLLALLLLRPLHVLWRRRWSRALAGGLFLLSFLVQSVGVFGGGGHWFDDPRVQPDGITDQRKLFDWTDPPFLYPFLHPVSSGE